MSGSAVDLMSIGLVILFYGYLGVRVGRSRPDFEQMSYHEAMRGTRRYMRLARGQNWMNYRYRKWLLYGGAILLVAGIVLALA